MLFDYFIFLDFDCIPTPFKTALPKEREHNKESIDEETPPPPQKNRDSRPPTLRPSLLVTGQCIYMYVCVSCVIGEDEAIYLAGDSLYAE